MTVEQLRRNPKFNLKSSILNSLMADLGSDYEYKIVLNVTDEDKLNLATVVYYRNKPIQELSFVRLYDMQGENSIIVGDEHILETMLEDVIRTILFNLINTTTYAKRTTVGFCTD